MSFLICKARKIAKEQEGRKQKEKLQLNLLNLLQCFFSDETYLVLLC
jgi:hypothetical protein